MPTGANGSLPESCDVAVIGAGFTGLSAARTLARHGVQVIVLDSASIGWGASSRNGGMVLTGLKLSVEVLAKRYGMEAARRMYAASLAAIDRVEKIVREEGIECDFSRCGHLEVACKQSHFDAYGRAGDLLARNFNHHLRIVPSNELQSEIGSQIYFGGIVDEVSAGLNPARYVAGLARAAQKAGVCVYENTRVEAIKKDRQNGKSGYQLQTPRGVVFAENVIVGTSGYTSAVTPHLRKKIIPIGSFIIATERLSDAVARELSPRNRMIFDSKHYLHYYRLTPDQRMLFGGRAAFFPETAETIHKSASILHRDLLRVYPQLQSAKVEYVWGGTLDFTFDVMPHAGQIDGIYYAIGYAGHGVAMATYLGETLAESICGFQVENPFRDISFPGAPLNLYNGQPWFLPFAGIYYKLLDWVS
jgi:glycine/D-amino acid oxidase-like deaminating enzyme